mgnify:CR=1 FL=1
MNGTKLTSITVITLLMLASVSGLMLVAPVGVANAATSHQIALSASSGPAVVGTAIATFVTVTGTGFTPSETGITVRIAASTTSPTSSAGSQLNMDRQTLSSAADTVDADANGNWKARVWIADTALNPITGGAKVIWAVSTGALGVSDAQAFTVSPSVVIKTAVGATSGSFGDTFSIFLSGFAASEDVTIAPSALFTVTTAITVAATGSSNGAQTRVISSIAGGAKTVTATGVTSGSQASTTVTVNPTIKLEDGSGNIVISVASAAPSTFYLAGYGFTALQAIASSSTTIAGVSTVHTSILASALGAVSATAFQTTSALPIGEATIVFGGTSFNFASRNIQSLATGASTAATTGVAIVSSAATGGTALASMGTTSGNYSVGNKVYVFVSGQEANNDAEITTFVLARTTATADADIAEGVVTGTDGDSGAGLALATAITDIEPDANGALYFWFTMPASYGTNTIAFTFANSAVATPPTLSLSIKPTAAIGQVYVGYSTAAAITGTGWNPADTATTFTASGWGVFTGTVGATGALTGTLPAKLDAAQAAYQVNISATTSGNWAWLYNTNALTYFVYVQPFVQSSSLAVASGTAGTATRIQSGTGLGVHGLKASTAYTVVFDSTEIGSFTSTASGTISAAGVQLTIPSGTVGIHIIDILESGVSALYGVQITTNAGVNTGYQYEELQFTISAYLTISPSVANIGDTLTITGSGLRASTIYYVTTSATANTPGAVSQTSFTSDSSGNVPASVGYVLSNSVAATESGTVWYVYAQTAAQLQTGGAGQLDGSGQYVLQSSATLSAASATTGTSITFTGVGLAASQAYNVLWDFKLNAAGTAYIYTQVSAFSTNALGTGSAVFTVPSTATVGTAYTVSVYRTGATTIILNTPPSITVVESTLPPTIGAATVSPTSVLVNQAITVSAVVTPSSGVTITSVTLQYTGVSDAASTSVAMTASGSTYSGAIPAQAAAGTVSYTISALDSAALTTTSSAATITVSAAPAVVNTVDENTVGSNAITDSSGTAVASASVGGEVFLKAEVTNADSAAHTRWLVTQVKGPDGAVVSAGGINKVQVTLAAGASLTSLVNFSPSTAGTYTVEVFVFTDLTSPISVADKVTWTFTVS